MLHFDPIESEKNPSGFIFLAFLHSMKAYFPVFLANKKTGDKIIENFASFSSNQTY